MTDIPQFIMYVNDSLEFCCDGSELYAYPDYAKLPKHLKTSHDKNIIQKDIENLNCWIKEWFLTLNVSKCKPVSYGKKNKSD